MCDVWAKIEGGRVSHPQRIAVTGLNGQLAQALLMLSKTGADIFALSRPEVDITNWASTRDAIARARPHVIVHAAAATNVDKCEQDPKLAFEVNALGTRHVAQAAQRVGAVLVYVSTNYVFNGASVNPYHEWDVTAPINVYGASKLAGEHEALGGTRRCFIARTAMLYSNTGSNFMLTMRRLMTERDEVRVVADQYGNPTDAGDLADSILSMIDRAPYGVYHLVNEGTASWFDWACEIRAATGAKC
ncbi:MAG TPA: dTDP-4-dehydrorhamnose reductase, partial [Thermomicrobiales bacterium]|nr:dTDP-4-dehydrorhamnose reductase [Thermomicrobiales bacterium]